LQQNADADNNKRMFGSGGNDLTATIIAGKTVGEIADNASIDIGARVGLSDTAPDWSVLAGVNLAFGGPATEEKHEK